MSSRQPLGLGPTVSGDVSHVVAVCTVVLVGRLLIGGIIFAIAVVKNRLATRHRSIDNDTMTVRHNVILVPTGGSSI